MASINNGPQGGPTCHHKTHVAISLPVQWSFVRPLRGRFAEYALSDGSCAPLGLVTAGYVMVGRLRRPFFTALKLVAPARRVPHLTALAAFRCHPGRLATCPARGSAFSPGSPPRSHSLAQGNAAGMLPGQESKGLLKCYKLKNQAEAKVAVPVGGRIVDPVRHPTVPGIVAPAPATEHAVRTTRRTFRIPLR